MSGKLKVGKRSGLRYFGYDDIKTKWGACYDPVRYLPQTWRGTAVDILSNEAIPFHDRFWCVLRTEIVSDRVMRLFSVWLYRQTLKFVSNPDLRSVEAANVAERFALGKATERELLVAKSAAWAVCATAVAWSVDESSWAAAWSAAESAESSWAGAWSAAESCWAGAWSAAESRSAQRDKLIEMIIAEGKERKGKK